jgi:hypothetical protein
VARPQAVDDELAFRYHATPREWDEAPIDEIVGMLDRAFEDGWPPFELPAAPADHLRWKLDGPTRPNRLTVGTYRGRLAYAVLRMYRSYLVDDQVRLVQDSGDVAVDPELQDLGIVSARLRATQAERDQRVRDGLTPYEADISIAYSLHPKVRHLWEKDKIQPANAIVELVKPLDRGWATTDRRAGGSRTIPGLLATPLLLGTRALAVVAGRPRSRGPAPTVRPVRRFDERVDRLFADASRSFRFIQLRDARYLNWRYCDPRGGVFTSLIAEHDDAVLGFAAYKVSHGEGTLADLLVRPGRNDVAARLVRDAVRGMRRAGAHRARCWLPRRHPYASVLRRAGFLRSRGRSGCMIEARNMPAERLEFLREPDAPVHLMLGDTDWC